MRFLIAFIVALLFGSADAAEPPQFTVENKMPAFTVTNRMPVKVAAPEVVATRTFQQGNYLPGHTCPRCGRSQFVISGHNRDGTHNHTCSCGTSWRH